MCVWYLKAVLVVLEASVVVHEAVQLLKALVRLLSLRAGRVFLREPSTRILFGFC